MMEISQWIAIILVVAVGVVAVVNTLRADGMMRERDRAWRLLLAAHDRGNDLCEHAPAGSLDRALWEATAKNIRLELKLTDRESNDEQPTIIA
jgi:hypothetical protein